MKIINIDYKTTIRIINCKGNDYQQAIQLRDNILRKPLGLSITKEDIKNDCNEIIFAAFHNEKVIGVAHLSRKSSNSYKLRQMAIAKIFQKKGVGRELIKFIVAYAKGHHINKIHLHARKTAIPFYEKLGFQCYGNFFEEVGISHRKMKIYIS